jgi:hypothetical protein
VGDMVGDQVHWRPVDPEIVIARSEATKQSILSLRGTMDCFAALAMTSINPPSHIPWR